MANYSFYTTDELTKKSILKDDYDVRVFSIIVTGCVYRRDFGCGIVNKEHHNQAPDIRKTALTASKQEKGVRPYGGLTNLLK